MELTEKQHSQKRVFKITGRLDSNSSPKFETKILEVIQTSPMNIILDFKDLDYISSAGLRVVLKAAKRLEATGRKLSICGMEEYVREVFEIAGFDTFIDIIPTLKEALESR